MKAKLLAGAKRATLFLLAVAVFAALLGLDNSVVAKAATEVLPAQVQLAEQPKVTLEGNFVISSTTGEPTGFFELGLRIQTPVLYFDNNGVLLGNSLGQVTMYGQGLSPAFDPSVLTDDDPLTIADPAWNYDPDRDELTTFRSLGMTLQYNTSLLMPVNWEWEVPETSFSKVPSFFVDPDPTATMYPGTSIEDRYYDHTDAYSLTTWDGLKANAINTVFASTGGANGLSSGNEGVMYFGASTISPIHYPTDTLVATVRFYYIGTTDIKDIVQNGAIVDNDFIVTDELPSPPTGKELVWLAEDGDLKSTGMYDGSAVGQAVYVETGNYVGKYEGANKFYDVHPTIGASTSSTRSYPDGSGGTVTVPVYNTIGMDVVAFNYATTSPPYTAADYSAETNRLEKGETICYEVVANETFNRGTASGGGVTVVFYDWDNTVIGATSVPSGDARADVNKYVEENMVHPDLRYSVAATPADKILLGDSINREYTYRGKYDAIPGGAPDYVYDDDHATMPGSDYPLTNKLDYAFYRRPTVQAVGDSGYRYYLIEPSTDGIYTDAYPYVHGWAIVDDPKEVENVWTTIGAGKGAGELSALYPDAASSGNTISEPLVSGDTTLTNYTYVTDDTSNYFELADFSDVTQYDRVIYVKAVYEPTVECLDYTFFYEVTVPARYTKFNTEDSTGDGTFVISFTYERVTDDTGEYYGVARTREPAIRVQMYGDLMYLQKSDITNTSSKSYYQQVNVNNTDSIVAEITVSSAITSVDYALMDIQNSNMVVGSRRGTTNTAQSEPVPTSFDYNAVNYDYSKRLGTTGFIYYSSVGVLYQEGTKLVTGLTSEFSTHITPQTLADMNIREDGGTLITSITPTITNKLQAAMQAAWNAHLANDDTWYDPVTGNVWMSYHELQYYYIHGTLTIDRSDPPVNEYGWCRQHANCIALTSGAPTDPTSFMKAVYDYISGGDQTAYDAISKDLLDSLYLYSESNAPYASATVFKTRIDTIAASLSSSIPGYTSGDTVTWEQLQYWLMHGGSLPTVLDANNESDVTYWWKDGDSKITNRATLITGANTNSNDNALRQAFAVGVIDDEHFYINDGAGGKRPLVSGDYLQLKAAINAYVAVTPSWDQIQYYLLNGSATDATTAQNESENNYWWKAGGEEFDDSTTDNLLKSILRAAIAAKSGNNAAINQLTQAQLDSLYFASDFVGTQFSLDITAFKTAIKRVGAVTGATDSLTWDQVQYMLLRAAVAAQPVAMPEINAFNKENKFYYWKNGGTETAEPMDASMTPDQLIKAFTRAAYRVEMQGSTVAWNNLDETIITAARLIKVDDNAATFLTQTLFGSGDVSTFQSDMEALVATAMAADATQSVAFIPMYIDVVWKQVQHWILNIIYEKYDYNIADVWWMSVDDNPASSGKTGEDYFGELLPYIIETVNDFNDTNLAAYLISPIGDTAAQAMGFFMPDGTPIADAMTLFYAIADIMNTYAYNFSDPTMTWYQIQAIILDVWGGSSLDLTDESALIVYIDGFVPGFTAPSWASTPISTSSASDPVIIIPITETNIETVTETNVERLVETVIEDGVKTITTTTTTTKTVTTTTTTTANGETTTEVDVQTSTETEVEVVTEVLTPPAEEQNETTPPPVEEDDEQEETTPPPVEEDDEQEETTPPPVEEDDEQDETTPPPVEEDDEQEETTPPPVEEDDEQDDETTPPPVDITNEATQFDIIQTAQPQPQPPVVERRASRPLPPIEDTQIIDNLPFNGSKIYAIKTNFSLTPEIGLANMRYNVVQSDVGSIVQSVTRYEFGENIVRQIAFSPHFLRYILEILSKIAINSEVLYG